jgi:murein DD-endopeptidase MepM/ murein hydrolase activator NlpD
VRAALILALISTAAWGADYSVINRQLERGQTLSGALKAAQVDTRIATRLLEALAGVFDVRSARPGNQVRLVNVDGFIEAMDLRLNAMDEYQVRRDGWRYVAQKRPVQMQRHVARLELDVETSLYDAAMSSGHDPVVAMALADAFGWELDFSRDAKLGDRAVMLVELFEHKGRLVRYGDVLAAEYQRARGAPMSIYRYELPSGEHAWYFADGTSAQRTFLKSPVGWAPISSPFGWRMHPLFNEMRFHDGVDYGMPVGTPVHAVASGVVTVAGYSGGGGNMVCLQHEDGYESCYLHLSKIAPGIELDAPVFRKQVIGLSGNTGASTKPHMHYTLKRDQYAVDPLRQWFPREQSLPQDLRKSFNKTVAKYQAQLSDDVVPLSPAR